MRLLVAIGAQVDEGEGDRVDQQPAGADGFQGIYLLKDFAALAGFRERLAKIADQKTPQRRAERRFLETEGKCG